MTNTLGVSDIRKNHFRMYTIKHSDDADQNIINLFQNRVNIDVDNFVESIDSYLHEWNINEYSFYDLLMEGILAFDEKRKQDENEYSW